MKFWFQLVNRVQRYWAAFILYHLGLIRGPICKILKNLFSVPKKCPLGEVLISISQQGHEILCGLHFVMFCLYLRGQSTFWGYFFTFGALFYWPMEIWCQIGPKWPLSETASMEVRWTQLLWDLKNNYKSALHAKFDHYTTSGSWVMVQFVQKTSNAHSPLFCFDRNMQMELLATFWMVFGNLWSKNTWGDYISKQKKTKANYHPRLKERKEPVN